MSLNKAMLMGRLTKDPELKEAGQHNVCRFALAVDRKFTKQGEERQADFIPIVAWNKTAEFCSKYFAKGQKVVVVGRIQTGSYEKDGMRVYTTSVVAEELFFAESKGCGAKPSQSKKSDTDSSEYNGEYYPLGDSDELPF